MSLLTLILSLAVIAVLYFALRSYCNRWKRDIEVTRHARGLIDYIHDCHPQFWTRSGDITIIDNANIELEFCKLPQYRLAFAEMNVALESASLDQQCAGFSHVLNYYGNQILVKNFVDVTNRTTRVA